MRFLSPVSGTTLFAVDGMRNLSLGWEVPGGGEEGISACSVGGEGNCVGVVSIDCRARHDWNRLLIVGVGDSEGEGERGGDANRRLWFRDGWESAWDESPQANADGNNIFYCIVISEYKFECSRDVDGTVKIECRRQQLSVICLFSRQKSKVLVCDRRPIIMRRKASKLCNGFFLSFKGYQKIRGAFFYRWKR